MNEGYNSYNEPGQQNAGQDSSQNTGYYYQNYSQNGYQNGYQNRYEEPPRKKGSVGKVIAITLGMVLLVGVAAIGGYSAHTIFEKLTHKETTLPQEIKPDKEAEKITVIQPEMSSGSTNSVSGVILTDVSNVVEQVMPAVVSITNSTYYTYNTGFGFWGETAQKPVESSGSGIIIGQNETELLIVTNNHVIENNESLTVQFTDESTASAIVKGADPSVDVAIVAVPLEELSAETRSAIAIAVVGDSGRLRMGQGVIAIGNAMGYGQSVTTGCISALEREVTTDNGNTLKVLQTDAAINPGNSGGALLNQNGEVIGINTAKLVNSTAEGIGYAIPISSVLDLINDMMNWETMEKVTQDNAGFMGVELRADIDKQTAQLYGMPMGVYVYVSKGGPAEKAGMQDADIIVGVGRYTVLNSNDLSNAMAYYKGGETITVTVQRMIDGQYQEIKLDVTLAFKKDQKN